MNVKDVRTQSLNGGYLFFSDCVGRIMRWIGIYSWFTSHNLPSVNPNVTVFFFFHLVIVNTCCVEIIWKT